MLPLFSTITFWPIRGASSCAVSRAPQSWLLPGAAVTIRITFVGYLSWLHAASTTDSSALPARTAAATLVYKRVLSRRRRIAALTALVRYAPVCHQERGSEARNGF